MDFSDQRYNGQMPYARCGKSGVLLPQISLGCWHNFGDVDDQNEIQKILFRAFDKGITHWDLANNYGPPPGSAETNVGRILAQDFHQYRDELIIASKVGHLMWLGPYGDGGSRKQVLASLDQSLERLQLDYVDIFYSHRPDFDTPLEETMSALITAVESGRALYVGISKYPLPMLKEAVAILRSAKVPCLIYQPPYSILNRKVEEDGILDWLADNGIGCAAFSPLSQGMLTPKYLSGTIPEGSRAARKEGFLQVSQVETQQEKIIKLGAIAQKAGMPLHHLALKWSLLHRGATTSIIGARTVMQLDDSLAALQAPDLAPEIIAEINLICPLSSKA